jgi:uncharacterized low-complexity protein
MSKNSKLKPLTAALGTILATSAFVIPAAGADENPFKLTELSSGYMLAEHEGKCGEGKCGMKMMMKKMDANKDGAISKEEFMQQHEKKFDKKDKNSDGLLTEDEMQMMKKGKCGCMKMKEGQCGEKMKDEHKSHS